jgi:hypothetical protein
LYRRASALAFNASVLIELAEVGYHLLNDATTDANTANKAPIAVNLSVLLANHMAQIHAPTRENTQGLHYRPKSAQLAT